MYAALLAQQWRVLATQQRRLGADAQARTLEYCADELEAQQLKHDGQVLSLREAADRSGYSTEHLGRLVRQGNIPNAGRRGAPRIAVRDLPVKSTSLSGTSSEAQLDREQIVRSAID